MATDKTVFIIVNANDINDNSLAWALNQDPIIHDGAVDPYYDTLEEAQADADIIEEDDDGERVLYLAHPQALKYVDPRVQEMVNTRKLSR